MTLFHVPLFERHICQVMHLLKYLISHFEMRFLELAEPPVISIGFETHLRLMFQRRLIRELI